MSKSCNNFRVRLCGTKVFLVNIGNGQKGSRQQRAEAAEREREREWGRGHKGTTGFCNCAVSAAAVSRCCCCCCFFFFGALKRKISPSCNKNPRRLLPTLPAASAAAVVVVVIVAAAVTQIIRETGVTSFLRALRRHAT